jgi:hypothetical protein
MAENDGELIFGVRAGSVNFSERVRDGRLRIEREGRGVAGARLSMCLARTGEPAPLYRDDETYSDRYEAPPLADAEGFFPPSFAPEGFYTVTVSDPTGVELMSMELAIPSREFRAAAWGHFK